MLFHSQLGFPEIKSGSFGRIWTLTKEWSAFTLDFLILDQDTTKYTCTLVPTALPRHGKTEPKLAVSSLVHPRHRKREFELPPSLLVPQPHWKRNWNFYSRLLFPHDFAQQNCNCHFRFSSSIFARHWKQNLNFDFRFSFLCSVILSQDVAY